MADQNMQAAFTRCYTENEWHNNGSGTGSSVERTAEYRHFLEHFIGINNVRSVVDVGCGDWQATRYIPWEGIDYLGIDVVGSVIEKNHKLFAAVNPGGPSIGFACGDAMSSYLPIADLLICKDVLQHWPNELVNRFLDKTYKFRWRLFVNTTNGIDHNSEISAVGDYRPIDLTKPPFNRSAVNLLRYQSRRPGDSAEDEKTVQLLVEQ